MHIWVAHVGFSGDLKMGGGDKEGDEYKKSYRKNWAVNMIIL